MAWEQDSADVTEQIVHVLDSVLFQKQWKSYCCCADGPLRNIEAV